MFGFNRQAISMGEIYKAHSGQVSPASCGDALRCHGRRRRTSARRAPVSYESDGRSV